MAKKQTKVKPENILEACEFMKQTVEKMGDEGRKLIDEEVLASAKRLRGYAMDLKKAAAQLRKDTSEVVKQMRVNRKKK